MGKTYRRSSDDYGYDYGRPKSLREKRRAGNNVRKKWDNVSDYEGYTQSSRKQQLPAEERGEW
jgi:hypothetical protein